jgi:very-short-patch-repair endonuclease
VDMGFLKICPRKAAGMAAGRRLRNCLRANRLGGLQFRRQHVIDGFTVDFYCHAAAVVVEVDGPVHDDQAEYDTERDRVLSARGLRVVRFTNGQIIRSLADVLRRIQAVLGGGGCSGTTPGKGKGARLIFPQGAPRFPICA